MNAVSTIFAREIRAYFNSAIAYLFSIVFAGLACGLFLMFGPLRSRIAEMRWFFDILPFLLGIFLPALAMRLWAEERRQGTIELLMTFPMTSVHLIAGKFLAAFAFYLFSMALTFPAAGILMWFWGADSGPIFGGYFASACAGGVFIAAGMFFSTLTKDQLVAFILGVVLCLGAFVMLGWGMMVQWTNEALPGMGTMLRDGFLMSPRFESIGRGVVDVRDLVYFASYTLLFLTLCHLVLESHVKFRARAGASVAGLLLSGITLFLNLNVGLWRLGRFDLTEDGRYTVSPASVDLLNRLEAPVEVTLYMTSRERLPPEWQTLERDLVDFLSELRTGSDRLRFRVVDPAADREKEAKLNEEGIKPFPVGAETERSAEIKLIYSAVQVDYLHKRERLDQLTPDSVGSFEYDLVSRIHRLSKQKEPHIAVFAPHQEASEMERIQAMLQRRPAPPPRDPYSSVSRMLQTLGYRVTRISLNSLETIPGDADAMMVFGPRNLNARQKHEISRFLRSGRAVFYAVQTHQFDPKVDPGGEVVAPAEKVAEFGGDLLKEWGIEVDDRILMDERAIVLVLSSPGSRRPFPMRFANQIEIHAEQIEQESPVTGRLSSLFYMWGAALRLRNDLIDGGSLKAKTLLRSTPRTWFVDGERPRLDSLTLRAPGGTYSGEQILAVMVEGIFPDPFAGRPIPPWPDDKEGKPEPAPSLEPKSSRLVVVGSAEMFADTVLDLTAGTRHENAVMLLNAAEVLVLEPGLGSIRAKKFRPQFVPPEAMENKFRYFFLGALAAPLAVALFGLVWLILRRSGREAYRRSLSRSKP
jgi:ABC-2 type transport system permease protein